MCLEAANATIHKYFVDDVSDLIDCMDFGFHHCIKRSLYMHTTAEEGRIKSLQAGCDSLNGIINSMDSRHDKQRFLEVNHSAFMIPKRFEFQGLKEEVSSKKRKKERKRKNKLNSEELIWGESRKTEMVYVHFTGVKVENVSLSAAVNLTNRMCKFMIRGYKYVFNIYL